MQRLNGITLSLIAALMIGAAPVDAYAAKTLASASSKGDNRGDMGIAAIVGDEAISYYDVESRVRFIIATARLSSTPDLLRVVTPQVVRSLIDEKLQMQAAKELNITVSDEEVRQAIASIEQQRGMPQGAIAEMLSFSRVPTGTFEDQIRAQIAWTQIISRKVRPQVRVGEDEVNHAARGFSMRQPEEPDAPVPQEYKIGVIALPVEQREYDARIKALAFKLVQQVRAGASFEEVSRQFSSIAQNSGGKVETFWVRPNQLDQAVASSLLGAQTNTVTNPVRTPQGYTIIKVYDMRDLPGYKPKKQEQKKEILDTEVLFKEILLRLKPEADEKESDVMLQIGAEVAKNPGSCLEEGIATIEQPEDFNIEVEFNRHLLSEMPEGLKEFATKLEIGDMSPPVITYDGVRLYMLCNKRPAADKPVNKDVVKNRLFQQKIELAAQKYLRNLRRETFIEIRE